jgi:predicted O-linked N-acetylglucosamine transferase (SPINDLY family)
LRAAPVQVSYLGYPGTMGASYIDYLIADANVIPPDKTAHYSEKIAYLPDSYQVNGFGRKISERIFTRPELGLPQTGFVFACLNNNYKITPDVFDIWMRLLSRIPGSVLWLFEGNRTAGSNLRNETLKRGVPTERLIFAGRMNAAEHLARYRVADLFLDTFHYNAHTTASDALWAGLPVLTCLGETFAGRVAGSLLSAVGLPELISRTPAQYEALALEIATHPDKLLSLKAKLARNKLTSPLFDTARFVRNIEALYSKMWQRHLVGLSPEHIYAVGDENNKLL